jgi:hypothetical protein
MSQLEPVFSGQEQAVVYLFSRYWKKIPAFKNKWVYDIQMRFPDASMMDTETDAYEAIEFEYALSSFNHYDRTDRKKLKDYDSLHIIYWDHDDKEEAVCKRIRQHLHFEGEIKFLRLSDYFIPCIQPEDDLLGAYWKFCPNIRHKAVKDAYAFEKIAKATDALAEVGDIELLDVKKLYRTIGFNKLDSDFIECAHWSAIHFFTTKTRFHSEMIPSRLFVKPTGCPYFWGYFQIRHAFVIEKATAAIKDYFRKFYFYEFDHVNRMCFVYSRFHTLKHVEPHDPGVKLYDYLMTERVRLDVRGSKVIADGCVDRVDKILG